MTNTQATKIPGTGALFVSDRAIVFELAAIFHSFGFPGGSDSKESAYNARDLGLIPGSGRSPGEGNGTPLQYSCLENPMDRGAWWATVHSVPKSQIQLSNKHFH